MHAARFTYPSNVSSRCVLPASCASTIPASARVKCPHGKIVAIGAGGLGAQPHQREGRQLGEILKLVGGLHCAGLRVRDHVQGWCFILRQVVLQGRYRVTDHDARHGRCSCTRPQVQRAPHFDDDAFIAESLGQRLGEFVTIQGRLSSGAEHQPQRHLQVAIQLSGRSLEHIELPIEIELQSLLQRRQVGILLGGRRCVGKVIEHDLVVGRVRVEVRAVRQRGLRERRCGHGSNDDGDAANIHGLACASRISSVVSISFTRLAALSMSKLSASE